MDVERDAVPGAVVDTTGPDRLGEVVLREAEVRRDGVETDEGPLRGLRGHLVHVHHGDVGTVPGLHGDGELLVEVAPL